MIPLLTLTALGSSLFTSKGYTPFFPEALAAQIEEKHSRAPIIPTAGNSAPPVKSGVAPKSPKVPPVSMDRWDGPRGEYTSITPEDLKRLDEYIDAYIKGRFGIADPLKSLLVSPFGNAYIAERLAIRLMKAGRAHEALGLLNATQDEAVEGLFQWELVYSLALALDGKDMVGQRRYLLRYLEESDTSGFVEALYPSPTEPNSLVVLSLHALTDSSCGFAPEMETFKWILRLRPRDPIASLIVARESKITYKEKLALLERGRPNCGGHFQEYYDEYMADLTRRIQSGQVKS